MRGGGGSPGHCADAQVKTGLTDVFIPEVLSGLSLPSPPPT